MVEELARRRAEAKKACLRILQPLMASQQEWVEADCAPWLACYDPLRVRAGRRLRLSIRPRPRASSRLEVEPEGSLMEALEGDGSPWSYLLASYLRRDAERIGSAWHGDWLPDPFLGDPPPPKPAGGLLSRLFGGKAPVVRGFLESDLEWFDERPESFAPTFSPTRVVFYTRGLSTERNRTWETLFRHTDEYAAGSYQPLRSADEVLARDRESLMT